MLLTRKAALPLFALSIAGFALSLFCLLPLVAAAAQDKPADKESKDSGVTFTSRSNLVLVPVIVTDKQGNHVTGLSKDDFELQEDGKSKTIASSEEIKTVTARPARSKPGPGIFTNELSSDSSPKRLTIFCLDLVNTPFLDQTYARQQLIKFMATRVSPQETSELIAIRANGVQVLHDFSSDPAVLVAALKKATGEATSNPDTTLNDEATFTRTATSDQRFNAAGINGETDDLMRFISGGDALDEQMRVASQSKAIRTTLEAFQHVAEAFAGIPGRKSMIWATAAFPFGLDAASGAMLSPTQFRTGERSANAVFGSGMSSSGALPSLPSVSAILPQNELASLIPYYQRTLEMLSDANIAVYPVDARGLMNFLPGADVSRVEGLNAFTETQFNDNRDTMNNLAEMTGGKAFYNRNDLDKAFEKAADDSDSYYMLGYYLDKNTAAGWHKLHAKVRKPGLETRARNGFFVTGKGQQEDTKRMDVSLALISPLDYTGLPLEVRWLSVGPEGAKRKVHFEVDLSTDSKVVDTADNGHLDLDVAVIARTPTGVSADEFSQHLKANLKDAALQQWQKEGVNYNNDLMLPDGQYSVRFVVRDNLTGRVGSVTAPLRLASAEARN